MSTIHSIKTKPKRRWRQFTLRTLMVFTALVAIGCGLFAMKVQQARQQRQAVEAIVEIGGSVAYDFDFHPWEYKRKPEWLIDLFGIDFFHDVTTVTINKTTFADADLDRIFEHLQRLSKLAQLNISQTQISDRALEHLDRLTHLEYLDIGNTKVTDSGLELLERLSHLQMLYLAGPQITDASLEHLKAVPHLRLLALVDTQVTGAGFRDLQEEFPFLQGRVTNRGVRTDIGPK